MTFISEHLAQLLRAKRHRLPTSVSAVGCVHAGTYRFAAWISLSPRSSDSPSLTTNALILTSLTSYSPKRAEGVASLQHLADVAWADSDPASSEPIHLIIGAELYGDVMLESLRKGEAGQPIAQNSIFGWVISGPTSSILAAQNHAHPCDAGPSLAHSVTVHHCIEDSSLDEEIKRFWEVEEPPSRTHAAPDDEACENHFLKTHSRTATGRYVVRLPFRASPPIAIGDSRFRAEKQLNTLLRRLKQQPATFREYRAFVREYETLGHSRKVSRAAQSFAPCVFLPHHPVFRESSATSRLRVVFNASSVTSNGSCLNDHLFSGPKLQADLPSVILRWRQFKFVYTADIAKMYRQILVDPRDLDYQRILWRDSLDDPVEEYQLLTVTYGTACAPFLALRVLRQLTFDDGSRFPGAASVLLNNIYVDDVLFGHENASELRDTRDQLIDLLRLGGFELRKWASNSADLMTDIDATDHGLACSKSLSASDHVNILGIGWNPKSDAFHIKVSIRNELPTTKRLILSAIARLYDPLGWVTPVILAAKVIIQQLWRLKVSWDECVPDTILHRWQLIYAGLPFLNDLYIPRWSGLTSTARIELHGFADASNFAYAAVVYARVTTACGKIVITLLQGKSRVAPLKTQSVPRLELLGATLLARLIEFVRSVLNLTAAPCVCWSDSTVVLAWLRQQPSKWKTYVANRVAEVQSRLSGVEWRHIATADNPADCASRGLLGGDLVSHPLWWHGPSWLPLSSDLWSTGSEELSADAPLETKKHALLINRTTNSWDLAERFSSWPKLIRVTAYILRFVSYCRRSAVAPVSGREPGIALYARECEAARLFWLKQIQSDLFAREIRELTQGRGLPSKCSLLSLGPFIDNTGLLRVGGRLQRATDSFTSRHPILLAAHLLVALIVGHIHLRALHAGLQLTLSTLRREYWVLRARGMVKSIIHRCVTCARERTAVPTQLMGSLPAVRVTAPSRSFLHCGVDYAGPVAVRASAGRGIKSIKAYIALFICLASRAVHLELVSDYSTAAFLNAFA